MASLMHVSNTEDTGAWGCRLSTLGYVSWSLPTNGWDLAGHFTICAKVEATGITRDRGISEAGWRVHLVIFVVQLREGEGEGEGE